MADERKLNGSPSINKDYYYYYYYYNEKSFQALCVGSWINSPHIPV